MPADVITCDDLKSITEALLSQGICLAQTNTHSSREQVAHNTIQLVSCSINELPTKRDFSNASSARSWKPLLLRRAASREAQPQQKPSSSATDARWQHATSQIMAKAQHEGHSSFAA